MDTLIESTRFSGSFSEFLAFLRTDPQFYVDAPEELMALTALYLKRMDGELPRLFGRLPRMPYGIKPIPDYLAPRTTTAYYSRPAGDGTRAGFYWVNPYDLASRPTYEIEALSYHEAVPGHHLQIALAQEIDRLPEFRRFGGFTAFVEGWTLYAEQLGYDAGFYTDPYSRFGQLTYEMWRALRLVVDTGMHWKGWTRQQAIDYMAENSALTLLNITNEVDRYIAWPGQIEVQMLDHSFTEWYEAETGREGDWFTTNGDVFPVGKSRLTPFPPTSPNGARSFPRKNLSKGAGEWNHYYVRAINGEVRLWVNGEEVSGGSDAEPREGYLCLEAEGAPVEFKNIRIRELP